MLTPEYLQRIVERTEAIVTVFNKAMTEKVAKRILNLFEKNGEVDLIPSSISDIKKIKESGKLLEEIAEEVVRYTPGIEKEVEKAFVDAADKINIENTEKLHDMVDINEELKSELKAADIKLPELTEDEKNGMPKNVKDLNLSPKEARLLERAYKVTNGEIRNLTQTTACDWQKKYIELCDNAYWKVTHGVSPAEAIREAIDEAAQYGSHVVYGTGHKDTVEVAVARAVRTGIAQADGDITLARCAEEGITHVLVSSHLGARSTDKDEPANHESWQGQVYKLDWNNEKLKKYGITPEEEQENEKHFAFFQVIKNFFQRFQKTDKTEYKDFITTTGYGTGEGLCGWNCRHSFSVFYPGININNEPQYDSEENKKVYEAEQKQRALERNIRKLKRRVQTMEIAMKEAQTPQIKAELEKEYKTLSDKLKLKNRAYTEFCKKNNLRRLEDRLYIAKTKGVPTGVKVNDEKNRKHMVQPKG